MVVVGNFEERVLELLQSLERHQNSKVVIYTFDIDPSLACSAKKAHHFSIVLEWLGMRDDLDFSKYVSSLTPKPSPKVTFPQFKSFDWKHKPESDGHKTMCKYLRSCGLIYREIGNDTRFFDRTVFRFQSRDDNEAALHQEGVELFHQFRIYGKTDIAVLEENIFSRSKLKFAMEIKTVEAMSSAAGVNQALREAFLQLVGVNVQNAYKSPAVVLTNMNQKHFVLYLVRSENRAKFELKIHSSSDFHEIIHFANELSKRRCITGNLGSVLIPPSSHTVETASVTVQPNSIRNLDILTTMEDEDLNKNQQPLDIVTYDASPHEVISNSSSSSANAIRKRRLDSSQTTSNQRTRTESSNI